MTTIAAPGSRTGAPAPHALARRGVWTRLELPGQVLEQITPSWFASVMGTGIVANAAATLPWQPPGLRGFAVGVWVLAAVALVALSTACGLHRLRHRDQARAHAAHPVTGQLVGAVPMAALTVGAGTLLVGKDLIRTGPAVVVDMVLWTAGTLVGPATGLWILYRMITRHPEGAVTALPAWLMPIVPPMVSASTGALLLPHTAAGQARLTLLLGCCAMFGLGLVIGMITITLICSRLLHDGMPAGTPDRPCGSPWASSGSS